MIFFLKALNNWNVWNTWNDWNLGTIERLDPFT